MKKFILFAVLLWTFFSMKSFALTLRSGDVLLQPLHCWSCNLIEAQEESAYSHIGVVLDLEGEIFVAEAWGKVKIVPLKKFLSKTQKGAKVKVRRLDFHPFSYSQFTSELMMKLMSYEGNPYDSKFLWDNYIEEKEALYCSELVYKALIPFVPLHDLAPKKMLFDINPELWDRYFRGETPRGKLGISPEDFNHTTDFYTVGEL